MVALLRIAARLVGDVVRSAVLLLHSNSSIRAENLFLRRQLRYTSSAVSVRGEWMPRPAFA